MMLQNNDKYLPRTRIKFCDLFHETGIEYSAKVPERSWFSNLDYHCTV